MEEWREVLAVWLHEHGLIISPDVFSTSTDYMLGADEVECTLSPDLLKLVFDAAGLAYSKNLDSGEYGWTKSYKPYPMGCELKAVFVQPSPGGVEVKMHVADRRGGDSWTELLTYHGAYTVQWTAQEGRV